MWYIKKGAQVSGPFPEGQVRDHILIGRISLEDQVSKDQQAWMVVKNCLEVIPEILLQDQSSLEVRERLSAAVRWADERVNAERRSSVKLALSDDADVVSDRSKDSDRRKQEDQGKVNRRLMHAHVFSGSHSVQSFMPALLGVIGLIVVALVVVIVYSPEERVSSADCAAEARPGVNWSNCHMEGLSLSHVDLRSALIKNTNLTGARISSSKLNDADLSFSIFSLANLSGSDFSVSRLSGVSFRNANLKNVNFSGADLGYADFRGANIAGAIFDQAWLENAIWVDGRICAKGSIGRCLKAPAAAAR